MVKKVTNQPKPAPAQFVIVCGVLAEMIGIEFTSHAVDRMWERRIVPQWIPHALKHRQVSRRRTKHVQVWSVFPNGERCYLCLDFDEKVVVSVGWRDR